MTGGPTDWDTYLDEFHARHPGITEDVLTRCTATGENPYEWLVDGVAPSARIIDVGCGSGPARPPGARRWVGLDRSPEELRRAQEVGRTPLSLGDITSLPIAGGSVDVATCSMALMLVRTLDRALGEIHRILRPDGELRLLLATPRPLTAADRLRYLQLFWAARSTTKFPPSPLRGRGAVETLGRCSLHVESDESRRFGYPLIDPSDADRFTDSWYLPGTPGTRRVSAAHRGRAMAPTTIGIPFRRIIARSVTPGRPAAAGPSPPRC
ncbi:hypothetical protein BH23ACT2_BH23ACT2_17930 [soil metagenome]